MSWLGLDPASVAERASGMTPAPEIPTAAASMLRGIFGFTVVSVAGFMPWAFLGGWLKHAVGELGMYVACALVFLLLSGPLLFRLVLGPGALLRFMALFSVAFTVYAMLWIAAWMTWYGHIGSLVGLASGTAMMGLIFCLTFAATSRLPAVMCVLFVCNTLGYYAGGYAEAWIAGLGPPGILRIALEKPPPTSLAMLSWGVCYGIGFGAGLGLALHLCQSAHRAALATCCIAHHSLRRRPGP